MCKVFIYYQVNVNQNTIFSSPHGGEFGNIKKTTFVFTLLSSISVIGIYLEDTLSTVQKIHMRSYLLQYCL